MFSANDYYGFVARWSAHRTHPLTGRCEYHDKQVFFAGLSRRKEPRFLKGAVGCMAGVRVVYAVRLASAASCCSRRTPLCLEAQFVRKRLPRAYRGGPHVSRPGGRTRSCHAADPLADLPFGGVPLIGVHPIAHPPASKGRPLRHIACSTTASFRATATFARLNPMRSRSLSPQQRRALSLLDRVRMWAAAS